MPNPHVPVVGALSRAFGWVKHLIDTIPSDELRADSALWASAIVGALHPAAARPDGDPRIDAILANTERLITMSNTISQQQDANTAKLSDDLDKIKAGIDDLRGQLASVPPPVAGATVTQAQEDAFAAAVAKADAMAEAFAPATPEPAPSPAPVVFDPNDPTPNSAGGRNSSQLPGFDPSQPETP